MTKTATKNTEVAGKKPEQPAAPAAAAKNRPLKTFTTGDVSASVWSRDHVIKGESRKFYSVSFERTYRDRDGQVRYARSFNPDDLGAVMALCQEAGNYLLELQGMVASVGED